MEHQLEVPELSKKGWRTARFSLSPVWTEEWALPFADRRGGCLSETVVCHHHQLVLARWGCPCSKCCCCSWGSAAAACLGQQWVPGLLLARNGLWNSLWSSSKMTECKNLTSLKRTLLLHERRNWMEMEKLSERLRERKAERMKAVAEFIFIN